MPWPEESVDGELVGRSRPSHSSNSVSVAMWILGQAPAEGFGGLKALGQIERTRRIWRSPEVQIEAVGKGGRSHLSPIGSLCSQL